MKEKLSIVAIVLSSIAIIVSIVAMSTVGGLSRNDAASEGAGYASQYVMYVGTNDKDTYKPEHTQEEAREIVDKICLKYFEGYTIQEATGAWTDEKKNITHEYTIVCYFDDADKETVYKAADDVIRELNQNTVLIEQDNIQMEYYGGSN